MRIRKFRVEDIPQLVEILKLNDQYKNPSIEGPEAMKRVSKCKAAVYLVAEEGGKVVGLVRGIYDGSRALIHQISVHPSYQKRGIGSALVREIAREFKRRGAPTLAVTASERSEKFFKKLGFKTHSHVRWMLASSIDEVIQSL
jgi:N-acetylglutamate synthase-like GNAT family acetyltransferase